MRLGSPHDGAEKYQEVSHPYDGQPEIGIPFGLGIFFRLGDAEQVTGTGNDDEKIVAEHHKPRREIAGEPRATGPLHDIKRRRDQHISAEGEDHSRCTVSYTHLRAHETDSYLVCRLLLEK